MTKNKWLCMYVVSALSGASAAAAQAHGSPHDLEKLDANADGVITSAEFETAAVDRFSKSDTNHDGKVSADEMKAGFGDPKMAAVMHESDMFTKSDANHDGKLDKGELPKMPAAMFKKLDTDKSGALSAAEMQKHPDMQGKPAGGMHPEHEMKGLPGDANNDGALTKPEAQAEAQKMFKQLDANGDGKLSKEELAKMHGAHGEGPHGMGMHGEGPHGEGAHGEGAHGKPGGEAHGGMQHPAAPVPAK